MFGMQPSRVFGSAPAAKVIIGAELQGAS